ncbi:MAG: adenylate/guanylate cyclase domain-containing protein [Anaerolineae bacterium]|nr:adenylate/guanylate cyclase domain-containing protein [Anaerolineae bacterium]MDK1080350.1 adenylate/guanylate cyclase domain-containing protein [Anaerolineae bacterium]
MGDAVMASFREPVSALRTIWQAQEAIANQGDPPLWMKVGIHHGPCIVVNLDERLDYFGSMVNIAARLTEFSSGGEIVLSETAFDDEYVQRWLNEHSVQTEELRVNIKGIEEPAPVWKIKK